MEPCGVYLAIFRILSKLIKTIVSAYAGLLQMGEGAADRTSMLAMQNLQSMDISKSFDCIDALHVVFPTTGIF